MRISSTESLAEYDLPVCGILAGVHQLRTHGASTRSTPRSTSASKASGRQSVELDQCLLSTGLASMSGARTVAAKPGTRLGERGSAEGDTVEAQRSPMARERMNAAASLTDVLDSAHAAFMTMLSAIEDQQDPHNRCSSHPRAVRIVRRSAAAMTGRAVFDFAQASAAAPVIVPSPHPNPPVCGRWPTTQVTERPSGESQVSEGGSS